MAVQFHEYQNGVKNRATGLIDLTAAVTLALITKDHTPNIGAHEAWADISAHEVAAGDGYAAGGVPLANKTLVRDGALTVWDADPVTWVALTKTFKYGVLYLNDTVGGIIKPLIALIDLNDDSITAEVVVTGTDYVVTWHEAGIMELGPSPEICQ